MRVDQPANITEERAPDLFVLFQYTYILRALPYLVPLIHTAVTGRVGHCRGPRCCWGQKMPEIPLVGGFGCLELWPIDPRELASATPWISLTSGVDQSGPRQRLHHSGHRRGEGGLAYTFHQQGKGGTGPGPGLWTFTFGYFIFYFYFITTLLEFCCHSSVDNIPNHNQHITLNMKEKYGKVFFFSEKSLFIFVFFRPLI